MFPTGAAGIALFILRLSAAADLLFYATRHPASLWSLYILALPAGALCLGFITPYAAGFTCVVELAAVIRFEDQTAFPIIISIVNTAALGMLGPGAYSLDARIFGRRIVSFSAHNKSRPS